MRRLAFIGVSLVVLNSCKVRSSDSDLESVLDPMRAVAFVDDGQNVAVYDCPNSSSTVDKCKVSDRVIPLKTELFYQEWDRVAPNDGPAFADSVLGPRTDPPKALTQAEIVAEAAVMRDRGVSESEIKGWISTQLGKTPPNQAKELSKEESDRLYRAKWVRYVQDALRDPSYFLSGSIYSPIEHKDQNSEDRKRTQNFINFFVEIFQLDTATTVAEISAKADYAKDSAEKDALQKGMRAKVFKEEKAVQDARAGARKLDDRLRKLREAFKAKGCTRLASSSEVFGSVFGASECAKLRPRLEQEEANLQAAKQLGRDAEEALANALARVEPEEHKQVATRMLMASSIYLPLEDVSGFRVLPAALFQKGNLLSARHDPNRKVETDKFFKANPHIAADLQPLDSYYILNLISHIDNIRIATFDDLNKARLHLVGRRDFTITYCAVSRHRQGLAEHCLQPNAFKTVRVNRP